MTTNEIHFWLEVTFIFLLDRGRLPISIYIAIEMPAVFPKPDHYVSTVFSVKLVRSILHFTVRKERVRYHYQGRKITTHAPKYSVFLLRDQLNEFSHHDLKPPITATLFLFRMG